MHTEWIQYVHSHLIMREPAVCHLVPMTLPKLIHSKGLGKAIRRLREIRPFIEHAQSVGDS